MTTHAFAGGHGSSQPGPRVRQRFQSRKIIVPAAEREARIQSIATFLRNALPGKVLAVTVERHSAKRSNNLNAYYWGVVVKTISEATGYEPEEVHELLASKFLPPREVVIGGERVTVRASTSKLPTVDFMAYLEDCKRFAAVHLEGLYIPEPGEYTEARAA